MTTREWGAARQLAEANASSLILCLVREVALGTWHARLNSRTVVRPGCVLLGSVAPNVPPFLSLWVRQPHFP
jgi:hypothetical protein